MGMLQNKPIESMSNGFCDIGTNTYTIFEPNPPAEIKRREVENKEAITQARLDNPDFFDEKGNLLDDYREYFVEQVDAFPEPHNKWNKIWVDANMDMTLQELINAITAQLRLQGASESLTINMVAGVTKNLKNDDGESVATATSYWNPVMPSTKENLGKKWSDLMKEKDDIDVSSLEFLLLGEQSMTFGIINEELDDAMVETPSILLRLNPKTSFKAWEDQRINNGWQTAPWVECTTLRRQLGALEAYCYTLEDRLVALEKK